MEAVAMVPPHVWFAVHVIGIVLALSSRSHLGATCAFFTSCLLTTTMVAVGIMAVVGFLSQQPFWAASGVTLGLMAVVSCFERHTYEPDLLLAAIARGE